MSPKSPGKGMGAEPDGSEPKLPGLGWAWIPGNHLGSDQGSAGPDFPSLEEGEFLSLLFPPRRASWISSLIPPGTAPWLHLPSSPAPSWCPKSLHFFLKPFFGVNLVRRRLIREGLVWVHLLFPDLLPTWLLGCNSGPRLREIWQFQILGCAGFQFNSNINLILI